MAPHSSQRSIFSGLGESFAAVVAGNLIYFLVRPYLPGLLQHELFRPDLGLFIDFLFCVAAYGVIRRVHRRGRAEN